MMLLAIDVGNTNTVFGVHDGHAWLHTWRVQTVQERMPDEYAVMFQMFLREAGLQLDQFDHAVLSSVVPQLTSGLRDMVAQRTGFDPLVVSATINTGVRIRTDFPNEVGTDRIADAVAAYDRFQGNCIVVDFGTATAFTIVAEPGDMIGAVLAAGLRTTADALTSHAAQLPQVALTPPPSVIGRNTVHAMQSGLVLGHIAMVEGLIDRIKAELGDAHVIATGGLSRALGPYTDRFDAIDPWLTLDGLRLLAERNPRP
ncbi:MAG: type III pantothenate kinase [Anaerolineae bacterium]|nr:type III pantothenate kinase [Anaerolineae bacterium]